MTLFYRRPKFTKPPLDEPFTINYGSPQARGLVAWWPPIASRGGNALRDMAGGLHSGTLPATFVYRSHVVGGIVIYRPEPQFGINTENAIGIPSGNAPWSISMQVQPISASGTAYTCILGRWTGGGQGVALYANPTALGIDGFGKDSAWVGGTFTDQLYHLCAVWLPPTVYFYVNGIQQDSKTWTSLALVEQSFILGSLDSSTWGVELIGDTRIYSIALDPSTVWQMYDPATRWDLYAPLLRFWAIREIAGGAVRISPSLAHIGLSNVLRISPRGGV